MPFEIPESWEWLNLKSIGEVVTGSTPSKDHTEYYGGVFPFYKPSDLEQGINTIGASDSLTEDGYAVSRQIKKDSILVTCIGATIGKTGLIRLEGSCNQQINAIIPSNIVIPKYLYYNCISSYFQNEIKNRASATTLPILNKNKFSEILLPIPPINEQKRIVAKIEQLFNLIDVLESNQNDLESFVKQAKTKILDLAICGKLVSQDPNDEPASELLKRINPKISAPCDNPHYENLPQTWECLKLKEICQLQDGIKTEGNHIIMDAKYLRGKISGTLCNKGKLVKKGELLILVDGENSGEVFTAPCDGYLGSTFKKLCINDELYALYILYFITLHKDMLRDSKKGAAIPHLNKEIFYNLIIGIPPFEEQKRIVSKIESLFETLDTIKSLIN